MGLRLDGALARGGGAHQLSAHQLTQAGGKQLRSAGGAVVHQHYHGQIHIALVAGAQQGLLAVLVLGKHDVRLGHQLVDAVHCHVHLAARVVAQVEDQGLGPLVLQVLHRLAEGALGGAVEPVNLDIAVALTQHLVFHAGDGVAAAVDGMVGGGAVRRHVGHGDLGARLALQLGGHIGGGQALHLTAVDGSDKAAHFQAQLGGGAGIVDLGDAGIARGILHHLHADAHDVAVLHLHQLGVLLRGVVVGVLVADAQHIAVGHHVVQGGVLDVAVIVGAHVLVQLGDLAVHAFLFLNGRDGGVEHLARQNHGDGKGHRHGDDGDGQRHADADFLIHGLASSSVAFPPVRSGRRSGSPWS